jgi:DNA-binding GntR family transcriptional regulator
VARETAREAVQLLRDDGLVVTVPHCGTYVLRYGELAVQGGLTLASAISAARSGEDVMQGTGGRLRGARAGLFLA